MRILFVWQRSLRVPTLIVWGREDKIVPVEVGEMYQKAIPDSRLEILNGCGHFPHLEKPDDFSRLVAGHLGN